MTEIATILWWALPTAAIARALATRAPAIALRWPVALALWLFATGVFGTLALSFGLPIRSVRSVGIAVLFASAAFLLWARTAQPDTTPEFSQLGLKNSPFAPQVSTLGALAALLLIALTLTWNVLGASAGSAEFFAYGASARSAIFEAGATANLHNGALGSVLSDRLVAFPAAVQYVSAALSGVWVLWAAKLPYILIWVAALALALARLREAKLPLAAAVIVLLSVLLLPSLVTLIGRGSDFAWISACALACASAWVAPRRGGIALLFSALAFAWNPWLGWPLALANATLAMAISAPQKWRNGIANAVIGLAFVAVMLILQHETFLPAAVAAWFRNPELTPLWGAHALWQATAVVAASLAVFAALFAFAQTTSSLALKWYFAFALLMLLASLRVMPAALGATDGAFDLALVLFAPALVLVSLATMGQQIYTLSDYRTNLQTTPEGLASEHGIASATSIHTNDLAEAVVVQPLLDHAQMNTLLLQAYEQFGQGDFVGATALAQEVLGADANHPDAHHLLALIALNENRPGDALRAVQRAIDVFPEHALFFLTVADIYGIQERWAEQADALATASKLQPNDVSIKTKLVIAKRKALMAQAQVQAKQAAAGAGSGTYEIEVTPPRQ